MVFILFFLLVHSVDAQSPIFARLLPALIAVDFASLSLETREAGAFEASGVVMATAAVLARL